MQHLLSTELALLENELARRSEPSGPAVHLVQRHTEAARVQSEADCKHLEATVQAAQREHAAADAAVSTALQLAQQELREQQELLSASQQELLRSQEAARTLHRPRDRSRHGGARRRIAKVLAALRGRWRSTWTRRRSRQWRVAWRGARARGGGARGRRRASCGRGCGGRPPAGAERCAGGRHAACRGRGCDGAAGAGRCAGGRRADRRWAGAALAALERAGDGHPDGDGAGVVGGARVALAADADRPRRRRRELPAVRAAGQPCPDGQRGRQRARRRRLRRGPARAASGCEREAWLRDAVDRRSERGPGCAQRLQRLQCGAPRPHVPTARTRVATARPIARAAGHPPTHPPPTHPPTYPPIHRAWSQLPSAAFRRRRLCHRARAHAASLARSIPRNPHAAAATLAGHGQRSQTAPGPRPTRCPLPMEARRSVWGVGWRCPRARHT